MPTLDAVENVATGLLYSGVRHSVRRRRAVEALESVGLGHRLGHRPGQLSGGEQQRVAIARALVARPSVLFADEPTGALDSATGEAIVALLADVAERGTAVVVVTHDPSVAARFARRIHLRDGVATEERPATGAWPSMDLHPAASIAAAPALPADDAAAAPTAAPGEHSR